MVDAAGAIYVIGGTFGNTYLHDVWASTDGGRGVGGGVLKPVLKGVLRGTKGYYRVLQEVLRGSIGVLRST